MKKSALFFLLLALPAFLLAGCFETTEEITLAENGFGTYKIAMDFKGLFEMIDAEKAMDTTDRVKDFLKKRIDTTLYLRRFTDTATLLSSQQKTLYQNISVNLLMDGTAKELEMDLDMPFKKTGDVALLTKLISSKEGNRMLATLLKESKTFGENESNMAAEKVPNLNTYFDMSVAKNRIERKLNKARYDSLMQGFNSLLSPEVSDMFSAVKMNTIIHLSHAVKKVTGTNAVTSADKKTITVHGTLTDLYKNPEVFSYRFEY